MIGFRVSGLGGYMGVRVQGLGCMGFRLRGYMSGASGLGREPNSPYSGSSLGILYAFGGVGLLVIM